MDSDLNRPEDQVDEPEAQPDDAGPVIDHDEDPAPAPGLGTTPMPPD